MFYLQAVLVTYLKGTLPLPCYLKTNPVYSPHRLIFSSVMYSFLSNAILLRPCYVIALWLVGFLLRVLAFRSNIWYWCAFCLAGMVREGQLNGSSAAHSEIRGILFPNSVCQFRWQKVFFWDLFSTSENKDSYLLRILYFPIESITRFLVSVMSRLLKG